MNGVLKTIDMLGNTVAAMEARIAELEEENARLRQAVEQINPESDAR